MTSKEFNSKYVKNGKILPNDVDKIEGSLDLSDNKISKIENLPDKIEGDLYLYNNNISKIENLPDKIEEGLYLGGNPLPKRYKGKSFDELKKMLHKEKVLDRILSK